LTHKDNPAREGEFRADPQKTPVFSLLKQAKPSMPEQQENGLGGLKADARL
jgi:hypothetical protein